ncbi:metallophosphoesterase [Terrimonas sp. NA20]|uniref:Metallophosphoesterase n=1 Tax=Terrimonas ginsenosidimutans TaxID=2908004 RepID=A0ABS9KTL7_9BACT|nr:metallophosphoesterase [Terrimonas ginsenosidimutans]MCG2615663.1 metallophosphoesterase [Terrimonas ginsenosidimutans]
MRNTPFWWILICFMVLLDFYVFQAVKVVTAPAGAKARIFIYYGYWILSAGAILLLLILPYLHLGNQAKLTSSTIFAIIAGIFFAKVIAAVFFLVDDLRRGIQWAAGKLFFSNTEGETLQQGEKISRSVFLSWIGMLVGGSLFGTLIYGFGNKYKYHINRLSLAFDNLPGSFKGLKVVQISDIHSGSFADKKAVEKGIEKIMKEKPDLILFTGDLVNNTADEMDNYKDVFSKLSAPMGVYSTLGNHDYADYVKWDKQEEKAANLERLKQVHADLGWRLLMNEHIEFKRGEEAIALIGIENWSAKANFPKYGDLKKAYTGAEAYPFKILMSHDPSHWDAQVRPSFSDIDLTLSGHTHGMQFGVELPGFKWSPVQYVYKQWAGLYEEGKQKLYVNRGFGFIGYPGRVGIMPEITVFELI